MGRIGSEGCSKIICLATGDYLPAYEEAKEGRGLDARAVYDNYEKLRIPVLFNPIEYTESDGDLSEDIEEDLNERLSITNNKTEYQTKIGRRAEGLLFRQHIDNPVVNLLHNFSPGTTPMPLGFFTAEEQMYLRGDHLDLEEPIETKSDEARAALQKTQAPYKQDIRPSEMDFIDEDGGKYYKSILGIGKIDIQGSNVKADQFFEDNGGKNQGVGDRTTEDLYEQQMGDTTVSNVNFRQQQNFKAKQLLGEYQGTPTTRGTPQTNPYDEYVKYDIDSKYIGGIKSFKNRH